MTVVREQMSGEFEKFHLGDGRALHHFTGIDRGGPHDHPWSFTSTVLFGWYDELVYSPDGTVVGITRRSAGETFDVAATHIHRIIGMSVGGCMTIVTAGPVEREVQFYDW